MPECGIAMNHLQMQLRLFGNALFRIEYENRFLVMRVKAGLLQGIAYNGIGRIGHQFISRLQLQGLGYGQAIKLLPFVGSIFLDPCVSKASLPRDEHQMEKPRGRALMRYQVEPGLRRWTIGHVT